MACGELSYSISATKAWIGGRFSQRACIYAETVKLLMFDYILENVKEFAGVRISGTIAVLQAMALQHDTILRHRARLEATTIILDHND